MYISVGTINYSWRVVVEDNSGKNATCNNLGKTKCSGNTNYCTEAYEGNCQYCEKRDIWNGNRSVMGILKSDQVLYLKDKG